jgi:hypothetical protein
MLLLLLYWFHLYLKGSLIGLNPFCWKHQLDLLILFKKWKIELTRMFLLVFQAFLKVELLDKRVALKSLKKLLTSLDSNDEETNFLIVS